MLRVPFLPIEKIQDETFHRLVAGFPVTGAGQTEKLLIVHLEREAARAKGGLGELAESLRAEAGTPVAFYANDGSGDVLWGTLRM